MSPDSVTRLRSLQMELKDQIRFAGLGREDRDWLADEPAELVAGGAARMGDGGVSLHWVIEGRRCSLAGDGFEEEDKHEHEEDEEIPEGQCTVRESNLRFHFGRLAVSHDVHNLS